MSWDNYTYQKPQYEESKPGDYRCVILNAEVSTSKSGNRMLVISVRPSGTRATVKNYIVDNDYFDSNFSQFLDAFPVLKDGNHDPNNCFSWRGAMGAVKLTVNERGYFESKRFIAADKAESLPEFVWKYRDDESSEMPIYQGMMEIDSEDEDDSIPF
jgi:hypothetical protein